MAKLLEMSISLNCLRISRLRFHIIVDMSFSRSNPWLHLDCDGVFLPKMSDDNGNKLGGKSGILKTKDNFNPNKKKMVSFGCLLHCCK